MIKLTFSLFIMILFVNFINWNVILLLVIITLFIYINLFILNDWYRILRYVLGGDILSFSLILLRIWISFLMVLARSLLYKNNNYNNEFIFIVLLLLLFLIISFRVNNLFLYYLFFECSLIPTLILIFGWGYQPERLMAGYYLLFYTLFFSLPLLISIFYINNNFYSIFYFIIYFEINFYLYFAILIAFLAKIPIIFVHFWLPKAHVEAPISGSIVLAGILLKLGGYGIIRVFCFIKNVEFNYFFLSFSLFGIFIVGILCIFQTDIKCLIAYSSIAHIGLVICGLIRINILGIIGSVILIIGHGLCSSGIFCLANISYERSSSRRIFINKGILTYIPRICLFWFLLMVNNISSPPSLNLLGEILLINGIISWSPFSLFYLIFSSFMACIYRIYLYSSVNHGSVYKGLISGFYGYYIEYYLVFLHWLPLNIFFLKFDIFSIISFCLNSLLRIINCDFIGIFIYFRPYLLLWIYIFCFLFIYLFLDFYQSF